MIDLKMIKFGIVLGIIAAGTAFVGAIFGSLTVLGLAISFALLSLAISLSEVFKMHTLTTFGELKRGDQFIGNPHGGWFFIKTDMPHTAVRIADGGTVSTWMDHHEVYLVKAAS